MSDFTKRHLKLCLVDRNQEMVDAWRDAFGADPRVWINHDQVIQAAQLIKADAVVSPANSFGYMDGGIDAQYRLMFGLHIETDIITTIRARWGGHLPVGEAEVIYTAQKVPYIIVAPTMEYAGKDISGTQNAYITMHAALKAVFDYNEHPRVRGIDLIVRLLCPGLGTGVGKLPRVVAAQQMAKAWKEVMGE